MPILPVSRRVLLRLASRNLESRELFPRASSSRSFSCGASGVSEKMDLREPGVDRVCPRMLLSPEELLSFEHRHPDRRLLLVDCSYTDLPVFGGRDASQEFLDGPRLRGAARFDIDVCCDRAAMYPHMEPSRGFVDEYVMRIARSQGGDLEGEMDASELKKRLTIVAYDSVGFFSSPRVWWMLSRSAWDCRILNGGLKAAIASGVELDFALLDERHLVSMPSSDVFASSCPKPAEETPQECASSSFGLKSFSDSCIKRKARFACDGKISYEQVLAAVRGASAKDGLPFVLVDARPSQRFLGDAPEPREGVFPGRISHAINLPFFELWRERCVWIFKTEGASPSPLPDSSRSSLSVFDAPDAACPPLAWSELKKGAELVSALQEVLRQSGVSVKERGDSVPSTLDFSKARPVVVTCGSGMTACIVYCALLQIGYPASLLSVYDGSWCEWVERRKEAVAFQKDEPWLLFPIPNDEALSALNRAISQRRRKKEEGTECDI